MYYMHTSVGVQLHLSSDLDGRTGLHIFISGTVRGLYCSARPHLTSTVFWCNSHPSSSIRLRHSFLASVCTKWYCWTSSSRRRSQSSTRSSHRSSSHQVQLSQQCSERSLPLPNHSRNPLSVVPRHRWMIASLRVRPANEPHRPVAHRSFPFTA
jgi:hypothetical protein